MTPSRLTAIFSGLVLAATAMATPASQPGTPPPEDFTALAVTMGNVGPSQPTTVDIAISRWSTEAERNHLVTILVEKGADALLEALRENKPVGKIRTPDSVGDDLRYAHQSPLEGGGRRIVIATDRPIGFWEAREQPRSAQYPFTVIELRIKPDGKGEGKLSIATKVVPVGNTIYLEDYGTQPVMLTNVQARKRRQ
jgi:hypothetical protein